MTRRNFLSTAIAATFAIAARGVEPVPRKWRVGVIGHTGRGGYGHSLDTMWLRLPETEIVAIADPDAKGLEGTQKKLNVAAGFAGYREMLAKAKPELVAVCCSMGQHSEMAIAAAEAGVRGIYMEKPFCRSLAEADAVIAACEKNRVKLALAHRNRYHPTLPVVAQMVKAGEIGRVLELRGRGKEDQRGGMVDLWILGSHVLNVATHIAGKPLACSGVIHQDGKAVTAGNPRTEDKELGPIVGNAVHARFEMETGVPFYFDSIQNAGDKAAGFGLQVIGTKGIIDLRMDATPLAHLIPGNPFQPTKDPRAWIPITTAGSGAPEPIADLKTQMMSHQTGARDLIAAIGEDRQPLCSAYEGRLTVEMITAIFESHVKGGARIPLPLASKENPLVAWK